MPTHDTDETHPFIQFVSLGHNSWLFYENLARITLNAVSVIISQSMMRRHTRWHYPTRLRFQSSRHLSRAANMWTFPHPTCWRRAHLMYTVKINAKLLYEKSLLGTWGESFTMCTLPAYAKTYTLQPPPLPHESAG